MNWTISAGVDVICALITYSFLAYAIARLSWRKRGMLLVLVAIFLCAQVWLVAQFIDASLLGAIVPFYWLWTANWIVSAFAIVLLWVRFKDDGSERFDAARMEGCGALGIYWHIVLPLVRPILILLALFTLLACALNFLARSLELQMTERLHFYGASISVLLTGSAVAALPLFAIFFLAQKLLPRQTTR